MRLSIVIALFASALVLAAPVQDAVESDEVTQLSQTEAIELLGQFASEAEISQSEALEFLQQYVALEGLDQAEAGRIGDALKAAGKGIKKAAIKAAPVLKQAGKFAIKHAPEIIDACVKIATACAG